MPVRYALTKRKLSILNRLTVRHSYFVWLFSKLIEEREMNVRGYGKFTKDDLSRIAALTKLQCSYV